MSERKHDRRREEATEEKSTNTNERSEEKETMYVKNMLFYTKRNGNKKVCSFFHSSWRIFICENCFKWKTKRRPILITSIWVFLEPKQRWNRPNEWQDIMKLIMVMIMLLQERKKRTERKGQLTQFSLQNSSFFLLKSTFRIFASLTFLSRTRIFTEVKKDKQ